MFAASAVSAATARPLPAQQAPAASDLIVDARLRTEIVEAVAKNVEDSYVMAEKAAEAARTIRRRQKDGAYDRITSAAELAKSLTADLRDVTRDKHLSVNYTATPRPPRPPGAEPTPEERQGMRNYAAAINYGFERVERLPGNIGYIRVNQFVPLWLGSETTAAVMKFVADTEAVIVDLRGNDGGHVYTVQFFASYFFSEPVQLSGIYNRATDSVRQYWTLPYVPGQRYVGKDVYVLTSKRTFSGGEALTYDLKNLKRATIIGETTEGAANPRDVYYIHEHFWIGMPTARPVSPVTQTNWEGTGVKPDVETDATLALKVAHLAALNRLLAASTDERGKAGLRKLIETVEKELEDLKKAGKQG